MLNSGVILEIQKIIGYEFKDTNLLNTAFTAKTYWNDNHKDCEYNERMEFLGDKVLNFIVAEILYFCCDVQEGALSRIHSNNVKMQPLCETVIKLDLIKYYQSGKNSNISQKNKSDLFEAIVAAIYLDGGINQAEGFIKRCLKINFNDYKDEFSLLKEYCEKEKIERIFCTVEKAKGEFESMLTVAGSEFLGNGKNTVSAELDASKKACEKLLIK